MLSFLLQGDGRRRIDNTREFTHHEEVKQRTRLLFPLIAALALFSARVWAQSSHWSFHAQVGRAVPSEKNIRAGFVSSFGVRFPLIPRFSASFDFVYWKSSVEETPGGLYGGNLTVTPFSGSLRLAPFPRSRLSPYAFAGGGIAFTRFEMGAIVTLPEVSIRQKLENGPFLTAGLGATAGVLPSLGVFVEAGYLGRRAGGTTTISDMNFGVRTEKFQVSLDVFFIQVGLEYRIR